MAHKGIAITGTDTVGRSFRLGHGQHHPGPSAVADQEETQTTTEAGRGRTKDHTRPTNTSKVDHFAAQIA